MAEHLIVVQAVEGSSPFIHPPGEESIVRRAIGRFVSDVLNSVGLSVVAHFHAEYQV